MNNVSFWYPHWECIGSQLRQSLFHKERSISHVLSESPFCFITINTTMKPLWYVTLQRKTWHVSEVKFKPIYQILVLVESAICICTSLLCIDFKLIYQLYLEITNVYMLINLILGFLFQQTHENCVNSCPAVIIHTKDNYTCHVSTFFKMTTQ